MKTEKEESKALIEEVQFDSQAIQIEKFEERNEMIVVWRRGEGFFPDFRNS